MANNRFKLDGLFELKEALRNLPKDLQAEGQAIVYANADKAAEELRAAYPVRATGLHPGPNRKTPWFAPGQLKAKVFVSKRGGQFSTTATVKNTDPIAWLYDNGSQARHWDGGKFTGRMPPTHLFAKTMIRRRRIMYDVLRELLVEHGLLVNEAA